MQDEPTFDASQLDDFKEFGDDFIKSLIEKFYNGSSERIRQMQIELKSKNYLEVSHLAHAVKGSAGNVGGKKLMAFCAKLEKDAKETPPSNPKEIEFLVTAIIKEFDELIKVLSSQ